ncbi:SCO3242 family prenyltransferase [Spirillospora sp. NPDC127200]
MSPRPGDLARLVRAPAALTVPGDVIAGAAAAGGFGPRVLGTAASSVCLYWAGMALNDYADRERDAVERPERPIPSGAVAPGTALAAATGLTVTGLGLAAAGTGRRGLTSALALAGSVWAYDLVLASTPAGPAGMALARALNVLSGAAHGRILAAAPAAAVIGAHTAVTTWLSRYEVRGASAAPPSTALGATALIGAAVAAPLRSRPPAARLAALLAAGYAGSCGQAQTAAAADPSARNVRRAVAAGIHGLMPLQAALTAAAGAPVAAVSIAMAFPVARRIGKRSSPT